MEGLNLLWYKIGVRALAFLLALSANAQMALVIRDASGNELRRAAAWDLGDGSWVTTRSALFGASVAQLIGSGAESRLLLGANRDFDLARLWFGTPPHEVPAPPEPISVLHTSAHQTEISKEVDDPDFGRFRRLKTGKTDPRADDILRDEQNRPVAWYTARLVDGQLFTFALPFDVFRKMQPALLSLEEWNTGRNVAFDEAYVRAMSYLWVPDYEGAVYYLREAVKQNPRSARAWLHLGFGEGKRGRGTEKIRCYRRALELDPNLPEAHYNLGVALIMNGEAEQAEKCAAELYRLQSPLAEKLSGYLGVIHVDPYPAKSPHQ